ncbi:MAG: hypothetical protein K0B37_09945 [Bacteroidales bacterium]|nr:hypothetical protein [Bacteroidales bacterium]
MKKKGRINLGKNIFLANFVSEGHSLKIHNSLTNSGLWTQGGLAACLTQGLWFIHRIYFKKPPRLPTFLGGFCF